MFHESKRLMMSLDDPVEHGWDANDEVKWTEDYFPDVSRSLIFGSDAEINEREYSNDDDAVDDDNDDNDDNDSDDYDDDDYEEDLDDSDD